MPFVKLLASNKTNLLACLAMTLCWDMSAFSQDHGDHNGHEMNQSMYDALRAKVPLYETYSNEDIDLSMIRMGPNYSAYVSGDAVIADNGVLVLAHGFGNVGDRVFKESLGPLANTFPTAIGFGMSMMHSNHIQEGVDRLTEAGAKKIIVVPALSSPWNTQMRQWEYMFDIHDNAGYLETPRIKTDAEIIYAETLSDNLLVAEMILDHANELSKNPADELVIIVSHGPTLEEDNNATLAMLERLATFVYDNGNFSNVKSISLQNDAPLPVRAANVDTLRSWVKQANDADKDVLVITNLLATRTIQSQIRDDLEGLDFKFNPKGLSQHPNFVKWVRWSVDKNI